MADDLEMLRMLRSVFTGSTPKSRSDKGMTDVFMEGEYQTSPAYRDGIPTEKPLEAVEFPWEMLMPTMRALKAVKLLKAGKKIKDMAAPAGAGLRAAIKPDVKKATGHKDATVQNLLSDLNKNNPLSKRAFERIKEIDLVGAINAPYSSADDVLQKATETIDILEGLDFRGKSEVSKLNWKKLADLADKK